ncbi:MAG: hypothetical protein DWQ05_12835 [Calditrichaeota bacterium]|nr:MAG: hypothetical protein DWQ05_12835 [Calditrichota bacterium]
MFENIVLGIVASFIWFIFGIITVKLSKFYLLKNPVKRLWKISDPKKLIICASTSTKTDTGEYYRPATGIGQLRSLGQIIESLAKVYDVRIQNILLSINQIQQQIENDLILLGGPKNNEIAKLFLDKIEPFKIVHQIDSTIYWKTSGTDVVYCGVTKDKKVVKDYGIAIRMKNPFDTKKQTYISLFSGCHTYGTIASAQYFTEHYVKKTKGLKKVKENIFFLVECDVIDGFPIDIKIKEFYEF